MNKENYFIIRPFGPSIVKLRMPENLVNKLNTYVDKIISDKKKSSELDHGAKLAGMVNISCMYILTGSFDFDPCDNYSAECMFFWNGEVYNYCILA